MKIRHHVIVWFAAAAASSACAQSAPQPLNLNLPPDSAGTPSANAASAPREQADPDRNDNAIVDALDASNPPTAPARAQPASPYDPDRVPEDSAARKCDDAKYGTSQVHGSATVGVAGGNHVSGNYQSGVVNVSRAFGSCDNPTGGIGISIGVEHENFDGHRRGWH